MQSASGRLQTMLPECHCTPANENFESNHHLKVSTM